MANFTFELSGSVLSVLNDVFFDDAVLNEEN